MVSLFTCKNQYIAVPYGTVNTWTAYILIKAIQGSF